MIFGAMLDLQEEVIRLTSASKIIRTEMVQTLWSGYGEIKRYFLEGGKYPSVIVKHIRWPDAQGHPRGWNSDFSHQRKLKSYQVEINWYREYAGKTNDYCKVPELFHLNEVAGEICLIMEDLNAGGFDIRLVPEQVNLIQIKNGLAWLAHFHASFMGEIVSGLWPIGTYWHLDTRPEEFERMGNQSLKNAARQIDEQLNHARYQTIIHGDAKLANFCFQPEGKVAAVDFQYVGKGCGMKDVAYFISSCLEEEDCEKYEEELLKHYFEILQSTLNSRY